ncbi:MAG: hypothetical protein BWY79_01117 [Actinobacteria bacterium ADurb.Bin444]|nr:MAG: hypothetical protein BWY79_01117 [Actinobacteria bacterium ADurb.Bin444]
MISFLRTSDEGGNDLGRVVAPLPADEVIDLAISQSLPCQLPYALLARVTHRHHSTIPTHSALPFLGPRAVTSFTKLVMTCCQRAASEADTQV